MRMWYSTNLSDFMSSEEEGEGQQEPRPKKQEGYEYRNVIGDMFKDVPVTLSSDDERSPSVGSHSTASLLRRHGVNLYSSSSSGYSSKSQSSWEVSSISSIDSEQGNDFIQPEGNAERLGIEGVEERLKNVKYEELMGEVRMGGWMERGYSNAVYNAVYKTVNIYITNNPSHARFARSQFDSEMSAISHVKLPDCRLVLRRFKKNTRNRLKGDLDLSGLHDLEATNVKMFQHFKVTLNSKGADFLREITRRLNSNRRRKREMIKKDRGWKTKLDLMDIDFDRIDREVQGVLRECKEHLLEFSVWARERGEMREGGSTQDDGEGGFDMSQGDDFGDGGSFGEGGDGMDGDGGDIRDFRKHEHATTVRGEEEIKGRGEKEKSKGERGKRTGGKRKRGAEGGTDRERGEGGGKRERRRRKKREGGDEEKRERRRGGKSRRRKSQGRDDDENRLNEGNIDGDGEDGRRDGKKKRREKREGAKSRPRMTATEMMETFLSRNSDPTVIFDDIPDSDIEEAPRPKKKRSDLMETFKRRKEKKRNGGKNDKTDEKSGWGKRYGRGERMERSEPELSERSKQSEQPNSSSSQYPPIPPDNLVDLTEAIFEAISSVPPPSPLAQLSTAQVPAAPIQITPQTSVDQISSFLETHFPSQTISATKFLKTLKSQIIISSPAYATSVLPILLTLPTSSLTPISSVPASQHDLVLTLLDTTIAAFSVAEPKQPQAEQDFVNSAISTVLDLFYSVYEISSPDSDVKATSKTVCTDRSRLQELFFTLASAQESLMNSFLVVLQKDVLKDKGLNLSRKDIESVYFIFGVVTYFSVRCSDRRAVGTKPDNGSSWNVLATILLSHAGVLSNRFFSHYDMSKSKIPLGLNPEHVAQLQREMNYIAYLFSSGVMGTGNESALRFMAKLSQRTSMLLSHMPLVEDVKFPDGEVGRNWHEMLSYRATQILNLQTEAPPSDVIQLFKGKRQAISKLGEIR